MVGQKEMCRSEDSGGPASFGCGIAALPRLSEDARSGMGRMLADGLSHEISNLMTTVVGNAALLRNALPGNHPGIGKLAAIEKAAERAAALALRAAEQAQGRRVAVEPVNLNTIVYHVLLVEEQQLAPRVRLVRYINPDLWRAAADHAQTSEAALELVTNAVESISGKGRVYIGTRNVDFSKEPPPLGADIRGGRYVALSVEDNGCGMSPETRARVFEPGFTTKAGRRGMGLARVHDIVAGFGGRITVNSVEGEGAAFRVYLPATEGRDATAPSPFEDLPQGTETVLIVDDERMIVEIAQETLSQLGYKTLTAHNGLEAVGVARTHNGAIDLVLLDMLMPVMGGAEAYPLLREALPEARVIVCTGLDQEIVTETVLDDKFTSFLLKPFRPSTLAQEVRRVLDERVHAGAVL